MAEMFRDHYEAASSMQIKVQLGGFGQPANANFRFAQELKAAPPPFYADAKNRGGFACAAWSQGQHKPPPTRSLMRGERVCIGPRTINSPSRARRNSNLLSLQKESENIRRGSKKKKRKIQVSVGTIYSQPLYVSKIFILYLRKRK